MPLMQNKPTHAHAKQPVAAPITQLLQHLAAAEPFHPKCHHACPSACVVALWLHAAHLPAKAASAALLLARCSSLGINVLATLTGAGARVAARRGVELGGQRASGLGGPGGAQQRLAQRAGGAVVLEEVAAAVRPDGPRGREHGGGQVAGDVDEGVLPEAVEHQGAGQHARGVQGRAARKRAAGGQAREQRQADRQGGGVAVSGADEHRGVEHEDQGEGEHALPAPHAPV
mmetsp:Transcript_27644/g.70419  ORF Transcript_27644/g.70419 Transcript_27644/m.70419 type:complete len:230 (-) Transcript_27644:655-1344(-)